MASKCIDRLDQITQAKIANDGSIERIYTNNKGEFTKESINAFAQDFLNGIQEDSLTNPIDQAVIRFGDDFYSSLNKLNSLLNNKELNDYPDLNNRFAKGQITPLEYAAFINDYNYDPPRINAAATISDLNLLKNLNNFYKDSFSNSILGGFCNLMPQVFNAIDGFFTIIGSVAGLIAGALAIVNKLKNLEDPIKEIIERITVTTLIKQVKEKLVSVIEQAFDDVVNAVKNFDIEKVVGDAETWIDENITKKGAKIKDDITAILNDENKKSLVEKAEGLFDYAAGLFENPNIEEIQFLIARFCSFVANVEALVQDFKTPMENYSFKYRRIVDRMKRVSNMVSSAAVSSGAIRIEDEKKKTEINRMEQQWKPVPIEEVDGYFQSFATDSVEKAKEVAAKATKYFTPTGEPPQNVLPETPVEHNNIPIWIDMKKGSDPRLGITGDWVEKLGAKAWIRLDQDVKVKLLRLQKALGKKLIISSAWRSQQYNEELVKQGINAAKHSKHLDGLAVDILDPGVNSDTVLKEAAKAGFTWTRYYPQKGYYHLDVRSIPKTPDAGDGRLAQLATVEQEIKTLEDIINNPSDQRFQPEMIGQYSTLLQYRNKLRKEIYG